METTKTTFHLAKMPARQLAYLRHVGPYMGDAALFDRLFSRVLAWLQDRNLINSQMEAISVYHDNPDTVPADEQRISVGFTVPIGTQGEGDIKMMDLPAGEYAVGTFEILPEEYGEAWNDLFGYIGQNRLMPVPTGPMYESYKNDPRKHPEGKQVVDICIALN